MTNKHLYGLDGTIHDSEHLDIETDKHGKVVAVWFRCQLLPFQQIKVSDRRAKEMCKAMAHPEGIPGLTAVTVALND